MLFCVSRTATRADRNLYSNNNTFNRHVLSFEVNFAVRTIYNGTRTITITMALELVSWHCYSTFLRTFNLYKLALVKVILDNIIVNVN